MHSGTHTEQQQRAPWWQTEAETLREQRADDREARMQQMEDEQPRASYGNDTGGSDA